MTSAHDLLQKLAKVVEYNIDKMNINEFVTIITHFLESNVGSDEQINIFKNKIVAHFDEFNKFELALLGSALKSNTLLNH